MIKVLLKGTVYLTSSQSTFKILGKHAALILSVLLRLFDERGNEQLKI